MTQSTVYQLMESSKVEGAVGQRRRFYDSFWWRTFFLLGVACCGWGAATILTILV